MCMVLVDRKKMFKISKKLTITNQRSVLKTTSQKLKGTV